MSLRHHFLGWVSCLKNLKATGTNPGKSSSSSSSPLPPSLSELVLSSSLLARAFDSSSEACRELGVTAAVVGADWDCRCTTLPLDWAAMVQLGSILGLLSSQLHHPVLTVILAMGCIQLQTIVIRTQSTSTGIIHGGRFHAVSVKCSRVCKTLQQFNIM